MSILQRLAERLGFGTTGRARIPYEGCWACANGKHGQMHESTCTCCRNGHIPPSLPRQL